MNKIYFDNINVLPGIIEIDCKSEDDLLNLNDRLYFEFSEDISVDDNQIAVALSTLCGQAYDYVFMDLNVNSNVFDKIKEYLQVDFETKGIVQDEIKYSYSEKLLLAFSGGFDSLSSFELLKRSKCDFDIASLDFGGRFSREKEFFKRFSPHVIKTNFVDLKLNKNSMSFMYIPIILYSKHLNTGYGMIADIFETGYNLYNRDDDLPLSFLDITNMPLVLGFTQVGLASVLIKTRPELIDLSLKSLASPRHEKRYRKQLMVKTLSEKLNKRVFLEPVENPLKFEWGDSVQNDFLCLYFIKNAGLEEASKIMDNIPEEAINLANSLSLDFYEKCKRDNGAKTSNKFIKSFERTLCELEIPYYNENDMEEYRQVMEFLSEYHPIGKYVLNEQISLISRDKELVDDFTLEKLNSLCDEKIILQNKLKKLKKEKEELDKQNKLFKSTKAYKMWISNNPDITNASQDNDELSVNDGITDEKGIATLSASDVVMTYKDGSSYNVTLTDLDGNGIANKVVMITLGERTYNLKTDFDGDVRLPINLNIGKHEISAKVEKDDFTDEMEIKNTIYVKKPKMSITAEDVHMTCKEKASYKIQLLDEEGQPLDLANEIIIITLTDKEYKRKTNKKGIASLPINLNTGEHPISAKLEENDYGDETEIKNTIYVKKPKMSITAEDVHMTCKEKASYKIQLLDEEGQPLDLANEIIIITLTDKEYKRKTNKKGIASLPINLNTGEHPISAKLEENDYGDETEIKNTIYVKKPKMSITAEDILMTYKDGTSYNVQLIDNNGKPMHFANEIITITFKDKSYRRKTNEMGIASLPINLAIGIHEMTAEYEGKLIKNKIVINKK